MPVPPMKRNVPIAVALTLVLALAGIAAWLFLRASPRANLDDAALVSKEQQVYAAQCASCHGANLQGEANWMQRKASGRLPAPPHDASGHTWHHADDQLFAIVKRGVKAYAPAGYQSDMPGFESVLSDGEILAVLAFIKHSWPPEIRQRQRGISEQMAN